MTLSSQKYMEKPNEHVTRKETYNTILQTLIYFQLKRFNWVDKIRTEKNLMFSYLFLKNKLRWNIQSTWCFTNFTNENMQFRIYNILLKSSQGCIGKFTQRYNQNFWHKLISVWSGWNYTTIYAQNIYYHK